MSVNLCIFAATYTFDVNVLVLSLPSVKIRRLFFYEKSPSIRTGLRYGHVEGMFHVDVSALTHIIVTQALWSQGFDILFTIIYILRHW